MRIKFRFRVKILFRMCTFLLLVFALWYFRLNDYVYIRYYEYRYLDQDFIFHKLRNVRSFKANSKIVLESNCKCRNKEKIIIELNENNRYKILNNETKNEYEIDRLDLEESIFTCNLYNVFRRGPKTKVISFSLYGKDNFYYQFIKDLIKIVNKLYPDWLIRIYYDSTIDESIICDLECFKNQDDNENYYDIVDLCNIEKMPIDFSKQTWNASYMHGMTWRWLPLGDSFVDYFSSRDTDAWMSKREVDSVHVWLKSNTLFHVMRDSPVHNIPIVGGYWGYANVRNRDLAKYFFKIITNQMISYYYNKKKNLKGRDQHLLTTFLSGYSMINSTTHDSYLCEWLGGDPFPTRRVGDCFVGCTDCCNRTKELANRNYDKICPSECRPKEHQDWIYC